MTIAEKFAAYRSRLDGQRIVLLGLGREGFSTYRFIRQYAPTLPLILADSTPHEDLSEMWRSLSDDHCKFITGEHYLDALREATVVFKSPGISPFQADLQQNLTPTAWVTSNTELFFAMSDNPVIGVTGTKGKSTTASLIEQVLKKGTQPPILLGNIGLPPLDELQKADATSIFVAEFSSYQLQDLPYSPHIAVLQDIVPEHLNWHITFEAYVDAKVNILRHQSAQDMLLYNADSEIATRVSQKSPAKKISFGLSSGQATIRDNWLVYENLNITRVADVPLLGRFNLYNVLPAIAIGMEYGIAPQYIAEAIQGFKSLAHRLELVAVVNGVHYYDDSLSTIPQATINAIQAFDTSLVLIAGGYNRGIDYQPLIEAVIEHQDRLRALILFPPTGDIIEHGLGQQVKNVPILHPETMQAAVTHAAEHAISGDVVLMSPASPSYGRFKNYKDRGDQFKEAVMGLKDV